MMNNYNAISDMLKDVSVLETAGGWATAQWGSTLDGLQILAEQKIQAVRQTLKLLPMTSNS